MSGDRSRRSGRTSGETKPVEAATPAPYVPLIERHHTKEGQDVYGSFPFRTTDVVMKDYFTGEVFFDMKGVEVPENYSESATSIVASRYFRLAGVPNSPDGKERSVRQLVGRVADTIAFQGVQQGYLKPEEEAAFRDEIAYLMLDQRMCFNSPVLFNMGLAHKYGIHDPSEDGCFSWNERTGRAEVEKTKYDRPQVSACFINRVEDKMLGDQGIFDIVNREARLFKYGSGAGANWGTLREKGAPLSSGGSSSGLMSFLKIPDRSADCVKSGGTTRRAARMVVVDYDHPDIEEFVDWKAHEEDKARLLKTVYGLDEAVGTISGQNGNNSVRVTDDFMRRVYEDREFEKHSRAKKDAAGRPVVTGTGRARDLYERVCEAAWKCGDPGFQFDTTINDWHTCPNTDRINSSNPCSEFMFLDDSACNLASINLGKYMDAAGKFDVEGFKHAVRATILAQDILVDDASYPDKRIAENSHKFRPLGLGFGNAGGMLMAEGIPYDSEKGRALIGAITALMTGEAYAESVEIAKRKGSFGGYEENKEPMLRVMGKHRAALEDLLQTTESESIADAARKSWDYVVAEGAKYGFRNAQTTLLAPTGTISFFMNCDTTGIEPGLKLTQTKKLAGGGSVQLFNGSVAKGLKKLGYNEAQIEEIEAYVRDSGKGDGSIAGAPHVKPEHYPVFDCAFESGPVGNKRFVPVEGHIRMMAVAQPFLSGAISKTVNMPADATLDDVADAYALAHRLGTKSLALYRDGSKVTQPVAARTINVATGRELRRGERERLPALREGITQKVKINGESVIVRTGEYDDGRLGEIFINMQQQGSIVRDLLDDTARQVSFRLQEGSDLATMVEQWMGSSDSTGGFVSGDGHIMKASSIRDYIARFLAGHYLGDTTTWQVKPSSSLELRKNKLAALAPFELYLAEMEAGKPTRRNGGSKKNPLLSEVTESNGHAPVQAEAHTDETQPKQISPGTTPPCPKCRQPMSKTGTCYTCAQCGVTSGCN